jgi:cytoskeletal protein RodZ
LLLSAALLLMWFPKTDSPKSAVALSDASASVASKTPSASESSSNTSANAAESSLPDAPIAKTTDSGAEPAVAPYKPFSTAPLKPAVERPAPTPRQRALWYTLVGVGHSAAAFDAWSTRNAVSNHYGTEGDPFLRPFAHSNSIYAATQVSPFVMDFLGRRFMTSSHPMLRRFWWVPQVAGASFSVTAGAHNYAITQ